MNKKITILTFTICAAINTAQAMYDHVMDLPVSFIKERFHAQCRDKHPVGDFSTEMILQVIEEIESMNQRTNRDRQGLSTISQTTTYGAYEGPRQARDFLKDVLRNQPEYGGPAGALDLVRNNYKKSDSDSRDKMICVMMNDFYIWNTYYLK